MILYYVCFNSAPKHLSFVLTKNPSFDTVAKAYALLNHYRNEFGCDGYVTAGPTINANTGARASNYHASL